MKRTQKLVTWSIVILVVLVVLLMLMSNLRRSSRVVLPDTSTSAGDSAEQTSGGSAIQVVEVTPETVQAAIATLHRPEAYSRSVTVEYLWNGGSSTSEITVSASGGWSRTDRTLPDGQTRHAITNGETTYIWYNSETDVFTGPAGEISPDAEQTIPTYEDVLAMDKDAITDTGYEEKGGLSCIYVETLQGQDGYVLRYWVSVESGLLVAAEKLLDGETVYRMGALSLDSAEVTQEDFTLPGGTVLYQP